MVERRSINRLRSSSTTASRLRATGHGYNCRVPEVIALTGCAALSSFRIAKLQAALTAARPGHAIAGISARYIHFVEIRRPLGEDERATLVRLLTYGPQDAAARAAGMLLVVVPRPGTISPWS